MQVNQFVKIPKQLFKITPADARLYGAYLDFKAFNPEGFICPPFKVKKERFYYHYWSRKLIARRWATKRGSGFALASYQAVWRKLGVDQSWNGAIKKYRFTYQKVNIQDLPDNRKDYFKFLTDLVLTKVAGNKVRQIKWRLKNKQTPGAVKETETFMSCRKVAKLFGLRHPGSGSKYRSKYFALIQEPTRRNEGRNTHLFKCKKIAL